MFGSSLLAGWAEDGTSSIVLLEHGPICLRGEQLSVSLEQAKNPPSLSLTDSLAELNAVAKEICLTNPNSDAC